MRSSSPPKVSVIIPAYNAAAHVADAIGSVLQQSWRDLELIIVDDGSTDATRSIADECARADTRVKVVTKANGGVSSARNAGIDVATGQAVSFLDADDIMLPHKLEVQAAFLLQFPGCDLVYSDYYVGDAELTPIWLESVRPRMAKMDEYLLYGNRFSPLCPLIRSTLIGAIGRFDETLRAAEDWDFWIRAARQGRFCYLPGPVGVYRKHPGQMSRDRRLMQTSDMSVATKNFPRGSREWRILLASRAWAEGREAWWDRNLALVPIRFAQAAMIARSPALLRNVMRWA